MEAIILLKKLYEDEALVEAYFANNHSTIKAAKVLNCSRETVARALRRQGVKLDGCAHNNKGCSQLKNQKITDIELIRESKVLSRIEIAKKYSINLCNVDRRLKRLGLKCEKPSLYGSGRSHYLERAIIFNVKFDETIDLDSVYKRFNGICQLCNKKTDVTDKRSNKIGKDYPTVDHIIPLSKGGNHTWDNVQLAHNKCNARKCDKIMEVR